MEIEAMLFEKISSQHITNIRDYLDWEVWAPTRRNADRYAWYGIEEDDSANLAIIAQLAAQLEVVQAEYSVFLPNGKSGSLFGISITQPDVSTD